MRTLNTWEKAFGCSRFLLRPLPLLPLEVALLTTSWSSSCEQRASVRVVVLGLSSTT